MPWDVYIQWGSTPVATLAIFHNIIQSARKMFISVCYSKGDLNPTNYIAHAIGAQDLIQHPHVRLVYADICRC
jgi:hypothetical protein